jgi:hypothetical protein
MTDFSVGGWLNASFRVSNVKNVLKKRYTDKLNMFCVQHAIP